jgi:hypothetical protein
MRTTGVRSDDASGIARVKDVDLKLAVVDIPVSGVDRAKVFDGSLGWRLDADFPFDNGSRVIQFTPPGSGGWFNLGGLVQFGTNITSTARLGPGPLPHRLGHRTCGPSLPSGTSAPGGRDAWNAGDLSQFHGWNKRHLSI